MLVPLWAVGTAHPDKADLFFFSRSTGEKVRCTGHALLTQVRDAQSGPARSSHDGVRPHQWFSAVVLLRSFVGGI
jgi:hypothetical protein